MRIKFLLLIALLFVPSLAMAKGGSFSGGSRSSFSSSRSYSSSSSSRSSSSVSKSSTSTASKPSTTSSKTSSAKVTSSIGGKTAYKVGQGGYQPRFRGGYTPPAGSVVYYNNTSAWDFLPWLYIMNANQHETATVVQPDGQKKVVKQEGTDGMLIFNWIVLILLGIGLIALIVWLVNKYTQPKNKLNFQRS